ncbi:MAG: malate/lactate/ureidoglycolate dehydrogenase [Actinomycetia bacterium]|nr:malate/lactate/ureidoglycolate dehydrogenase [Actinomycetes bacterium]MCP5035887.1 malate/lactate/ureidoglycolate dehydrogenase [Actinomycetes bacterium]
MTCQTRAVSQTDFHPDQLREYVLQVCAKLGSEPTEAGLVADQLIRANLCGHDSHGIGMMPTYVDAVHGGRLFPNRHSSVAVDNGAVLVIDGNRAFGQVTGFEATNLAIERAKETGVALMGLRDSFHIGRIGHWGEQCARAGMVSIHFVNVAGHMPLVAPYGGAQPRFTTNPICIAIPAGDGKPAALLDMATSVIAMGKIRVAKNKGELVQPGALLDGDGELTEDPDAMFTPPGGAIVAFGDHKGSGLAIMCEILGAALTGGTTIAPKNERDGSALNSMLTIVIDPDALTSRDGLIAEAGAFLSYVKESTTRSGFEEVLVPGEPEQRSHDTRAQAVPVDGGTVGELRAAADRAGLDESEIVSLLGS